MKIFKAIIMSIGIAAAAMTASAQDEDFRLKWAENDGTEWHNGQNAKKDGLFTLVSENSLSENEPQYAKAFVFPSENGVMFAVANVDFTGSELAGIEADGHKQPFSTSASVNSLSVKYTDFTDTKNPVMQKIGGKATVFVLGKTAIGLLENAKEFTFYVYDKDKDKWLFSFNTTKTIAELCE